MAEPSTRITAGLLHPGEMGATVGRALVAGGARVLWCASGRSPATASRAADAGLEAAGDLAELAKRSDLLFSVCPPASAGEVALSALEAGFRGIYVDANAVAPATAASLAEQVEASGARFVDGGIIGPPARRPGTTRLYLSGRCADEVAARFAGADLDARVVPGGAGAASALKMAYAAWTKGSSALLLAARSFARQSGVEDDLLAEWGLSQPHLAGLSEGMARNVTPKAWRFAGEMEEIAASFGAAGLPEGFHQAAEEVYRRLERFRDSSPPAISEVTGALLTPKPPGGRAR